MSQDYPKGRAAFAVLRSSYETYGCPFLMCSDSREVLHKEDGCEVVMCTTCERSYVVVDDNFNGMQMQVGQVIIVDNWRSEEHGVSGPFQVYIWPVPLD